MPPEAYSSGAKAAAKLDKNGRIGEIMANENTEVEEVETVEDTFKEESEDNSEQEQSEEETKGETESEPEGKEEEAEPPSEKEPTLVPIAALHDKRRQVDQLKEEIDELKRQIPKTEPDEPDPIDDPEAWKEWARGGIAKENQVKADADYDKRVEESRSRMLELHEDYLQVEKYYMYMMTQDDTLAKQMSESPDAGQFAYDTAKAAIAEFSGNTEEETDETESDEEPSEAEKRKSKAVKVPSLATASATNKNTVEVKKDDSTVESICANMKY